METRRRTVLTRSTTRHNTELYARYKALADAEPHVVFGGRLGEYRYYDMDKVIESALACVEVQLDKINQYK